MNFKKSFVAFAAIVVVMQTNVNAKGSMKKENGVLVNDSKIEIADVMDSNGVIFVIDSVLMP